ncbi:uncharacterized protein CIMG_04358 [Coccidioides immitis RS]|uniref:Uncharacterized protein n=4 Tax=Coccidioides immitis TaxID=5501 RepID=J3KDB2_COCIM|nr:uncharacterized protein CIMG_04358 [Coccidioides immitis RS]EAS33334.3 hypothetical protein CIMG_04358 [Coccidioides immitis RS]KMP04489.1 hypothetical protein CIRG_04170 [Coccidioides immitis RMSCC 2394]KMU76067.1 hypothetical protein CISG_05325 [Coccidioides immitis RMSCC 3703]KMU90010.1 hypothetical protein CIHG_07693 [Coccidioides immitis H538.4]
MFRMGDGPDCHHLYGHARIVTNVLGRFCRCCWQTTCIHHFLHHICFCQYCIIITEQFWCFVLRCLQSAGSSKTIALASGVVADIATATQRGSYIGYIRAGSLIGHSIRPKIGGVPTQYLG